MKFYDKEEGYVFITKQTFLSILQNEYHTHPELVPFSDGDRAGLCGQETASNFAKRKIHECSPAFHGYGPRGVQPNLGNHDFNRGNHYRRNYLRETSDLRGRPSPEHRDHKTDQRVHDKV